MEINSGQNKLNESFGENGKKISPKLLPGLKNFVIVIAETRVVRHIVPRTKVPVDAIINSEGDAISAIAIPKMLPTQKIPDKRIILSDGLNFSRARYVYWTLRDE